MRLYQTISVGGMDGGCNAFDTTAWYQSYRTTYSQNDKFPQITRSDGLIGTNPCSNAT